QGYSPTDEDIVWSRKPTESIIEEEIVVHHASLVFIDVGGQTKERRKWCQCFSDMTSVLFLIASSHYDEHYQDRVTKEFRNKLREAMIVFEGLINHVAFRRVSIIIFFNKTDILKEKVNSGQSNIREEFPNYPARFDPFRLQDVQTFMVEAFVSLVNQSASDPVPMTTAPRLKGAGRGSLSGPSFSGTNRSDSGTGPRRTSAPGCANTTLAINTPKASMPPVRRRMLYRHFTTAVDRRNIETVFHAMQDTVLQINLRRIMMS
ncbi:Guanine nucleotide binding protein subunit, partial [Fasciolopsis buskii]